MNIILIVLTLEVLKIGVKVFPNLQESNISLMSTMLNVSITEKSNCARSNPLNIPQQELALIGKRTLPLKLRDKCKCSHLYSLSFLT